ncbi:ribosome-recycling factor, mitochondrial isoform X1 [Phaenicophaeus curvirostris]|uniref:ribosome-recycling factor, mitochondrial isoform X1 n=1 Tax=Phaenicophaeus curvirostris TaxID=33595 RepID=UPI0037F0CEA6
MATALRCVRHVPSLLYRSSSAAVRELPQAPTGCPASLLGGCGQRVPLVLLTRQLATKKAKGKGQAPAKVNISAALVEDIINLEETNEDMQAVIEALKEDFSRNLSVRTSPGALDHIIVMTKDGKFPLNQLGQISQKSPQLIIVNMTDFPESTAAAAKAIRESGMNLNPETDGTIIRVPIPKSSKWQTAPPRRWTSCWQQRPRSCLDKHHPYGHTPSWNKSGLPHTPAAVPTGAALPDLLSSSESSPGIVLGRGEISPHCSSYGWQQNGLN